MGPLRYSLVRGCGNKVSFDTLIPGWPVGRAKSLRRVIESEMWAAGGSGFPSRKYSTPIVAATVANRRAGPAIIYIGAVRSIDRTVVAILRLSRKFAYGKIDRNFPADKGLKSRPRSRPVAASQGPTCGRLAPVLRPRVGN